MTAELDLVPGGARATRAAAALLAALGRALAVVVAFFGMAGFAGVLGTGRGLATTLALCAAWVLCTECVFAVQPKALLPLGVGPAAVEASVVSVVVVSALALWIGGPYPVWSLLATAGVAGILTAVWQSVLWHRILPPRRVLVVGSAEDVAELAARLAYERPQRFELVGFVDDGPLAGNTAPIVPVLGGIADLAELLPEVAPDIVVVALRRGRLGAFEQLLAHANLGFHVVEYAQFWEHAFGCVPIEDISHAWFMGVLHLYQRRYPRLLLRAFDIVVAVTGMIVLAPLFALAALLVRQTPGPVLLRQTRVGADGTLFTMYKFRTMRHDAEEPGAAVWASVEDPRTTAVGRLLRANRLDEIPQLWNVLRGDMSIVGPRPERPEFHAGLERALPFWSRRSLVKPGITGWAQIRAGYAADVDGSGEKLALDLWYLRHRSLLVDAAICVKTFSIMFGGDPYRAGRKRRQDAQELPLDQVLAEVVRR